MLQMECLADRSWSVSNTIGLRVSMWQVCVLLMATPVLGSRKRICGCIYSPIAEGIPVACGDVSLGHNAKIQADTLDVH